MAVCLGTALLAAQQRGGINTDGWGAMISSKDDVSLLRRVGYVLLMDPSSPRAQHTEQTLRTVGFHVLFVAPSVHGNTTVDKVWSNKQAFLGVLEEFVCGNGSEWLYLFEDDITAHLVMSMRDIRQLDSRSTHFMYREYIAHLYSSQHSGGH